ncbi:MAG: hypothetical protein AVDCRST_MAG43-1970 [uncultured Thermomicrobiales bacterium]|uniref:Uncharacterized protein n=1 Tax=uncultured Thermomicrobiales bacterium TaxID=1645740 RepID=A0A6J4UV72_9BACT|nr:MAG: hypothetical protein AVDCRST_MAG43-1970 [uncultured Thermomicrobiales bacterium]
MPVYEHSVDDAGAVVALRGGRPFASAVWQGRYACALNASPVLHALAGDPSIPFLIKEITSYQSRPILDGWIMLSYTTNAADAECVPPQRTVSPCLECSHLAMLSTAGTVEERALAGCGGRSRSVDHEARSRTFHKRHDRRLGELPSEGSLGGLSSKSAERACVGCLTTHALVVEFSPRLYASARRPHKLFCPRTVRTDHGALHGSA